MHIAILGSGRMARGLARAWVGAGHRVVIGSRDPQRTAPQLASHLPEVPVTSHAQSLAGAEVVVLAVPFAAARDLLQAHAAALAGRLIVDITNPFGQAPPGLAGMQVHQQEVPTARFVAAFKTNFSATLLEPRFPDGTPRDCFVAGGTEQDRQVVASLVRDVGFRPVDCGGEEHLLALDLMVPLMIALDRACGGDHRSGWQWRG